MYKQLKTWVAVGLLACSAGCSKRDTVREADGAADSTARVCDDNPPKYLYIGARNFMTSCFAPRGSEAGGLVRIPKYAATFETQCAVTIKSTHVDFTKSSCSPRVPGTPLPIVEKDRITIERDAASGNFALKRLSDGMVVPLRQGTVDRGGAPYLISEEIDGVVYAVYLEVAGEQGIWMFKKLEKIYRIEMFDLANAIDREKCGEHLPTFASSTAVCPSGIQLYPLQTGTSTGGEPPPN